MRFAVEINLKNPYFPKDKNRVILSLLKQFYQDLDVSYYNDIFVNKKTQPKQYTFSLYFGKCKFESETIYVPDQKVMLNFSTIDPKDGIMFYNAFISNKGKSILIKENEMQIQSIRLIQEKTITSEDVVFKTMSPIVVREHEGDNKKTWYHSLGTIQGRKQFEQNLRVQLIEYFGESIQYELETIQFEYSEAFKVVKVRNYGIEVDSNIGIIKMKAKPFITEYLYKSGIGSKRGSGFGMVDIIS
ncbi:CRISPR-associated endoribonuclease Cas6 [Fusibacter ferrireducens]|uniref:CRISPR-associated endoribonuclease Cas6 n=1 Tax=Fusibacter ferrireducens TaxID=2785058 RepID=A0ABR9ZU66_9FIRM|nr:CRISPR-associated endoribonuclease Cas6 [Fusibacter ferrireducens]MBF4694002.1 CRISPR-associated endoribonuclease Cas6 [Fusibacter ferrireducens]